MPSHYTPTQKQEALRLLAFHNDNVPIVEQLTGIPRPTLYRWRKQELSQNDAQMRQKNIRSIDNHLHKTKPPPTDHPDAELIQDGDQQYWRLPTGEVFAHLSDEERASLAHLREADDPDPPPVPDAPPAEPKAGVPGLSYPYLLEDDDEPTDNYGDFRNVRDILMKHAKYLAKNLKPDEPDINRRSLALARILDRVRQLDAMLPSLMPEQVLRHEFVYDGMVHDKLPWQRTEEDLLAQLEIVREIKADEARRNTKNAPVADQ